MTSLFRPWGQLNWLHAKIGGTGWHLVTSSSFEDRAIALSEWAKTKAGNFSSSSVFRITNPSSTSWDEAQPKVDANLKVISDLLGDLKSQTFDISLLDSPSFAMSWDALVPTGVQSVVLDVTTMPKRFFLFAVKRLIESNAVQNLVVCYCQALRYPEIPLCGDAMPPGTMQGFARVDNPRDERKLVLGVGYVALSVDELLGSTKSKIDFLFPFPPASPAFRRNWKLLSLLMPQDLPSNTEIYRVDGTDAFEVCSKLVALGKVVDLDLIPLGPKPHALGMAMACIALDGTAEIIYSQPRVYDVNYSSGISRDSDGRANVLGYCLKRNGRRTF
jgi:hypothetical protein